MSVKVGEIWDTVPGSGLCVSPRRSGPPRRYGPQTGFSLDLVKVILPLSRIPPVGLCCQKQASQTGISKILHPSAFCGMMTSSNGNIFRVTGHLCGDPVNSQQKGQWRGALMFSLICVWINDWVNNREAGDLRRYRAHHDVIVMGCSHPSLPETPASGNKVLIC